MQPDLQELEITKGEIKHLTGVEPDDVFRSSLNLRWLINEIAIGLALTPVIVGILYIFIILPTRGASLNLAILSIVVVPICVVAGRWFWLKKKSPDLLVSLLSEVDRYHAVLKAIDIHDKLEGAGTQLSNLGDRTKAIAALRLTRQDLVRAFKSERILREHKDLLISNTELFANNLAALIALQVSDRAGEYGRLLNESLQIGLTVQEEMRKLQNQRFR